MARLIKREVREELPQTDAVVGRELLEQHQRESETMADTLAEGEAVTYYDEGWRYGRVEKLPDSDEPKYGQVRILHAQTGRVWVPARDVKKIPRG